MSGLALRGQALRRALRALSQRPLTTLVALSAAALALWLPLALATLVPPLLPAWQRLDAPAQAVVFLAAGTGASEIAALRAKLADQAHVAAATHVPRDAALADLAKRAPGGALPDLKVNPLPDAIVVSFARRTPPDAVEATATAMRKLARVDSVHYDGNGYRRWTAVATLGRLIVAVGGAALAVLCVATLVAAARVPRPIGRDELALLRLVGARAADRRRPFTYAGALMGLGAAALAVAGQAALLASFGPALVAQASALGLEAAWTLPAAPVLVGTVIAAAAVGGSAGALAGRQAERASRA